MNRLSGAYFIALKQKDTSLSVTHTSGTTLEDIDCCPARNILEKQRQ